MSIDSNLTIQVKEYLEVHSMSQAAFAKACDMSESTFSRWYKGSYPGDARNIIQKIETYLEKQKDRGEIHEVVNQDFAQTIISQKIWNTLDYGRIQKQIVCIYGDAGCGKTFTAEKWMEGKTDVFFLTGSPVFNSPKSFLKLLARVLKCRTSGNKDDLFFEIVEKLQGTDTMLVLDESQHFNINTIEMIRSVKESAGIGLALIGNETIYDRLVGRQRAEFAQLFSRLLMRTKIMTDFFCMEDVEKVFGELPESEQKYLLNICRSRYGLRGAVFLYNNALNNNNISGAGLAAMARQMGISVGL